MIAIIGPRDAGKTSLISSLYDLFQEGPILEISYAQSQTLHAFELACHDARAASRRTAPHTYRTPRGEVRFYHLDLSGGPAGHRLGLVLGDRAGEDYQVAADNVSVAMTFPEVRRADSLTVLVDGERLTNSGARHNLRSEILMMLQGLKDGGAIPVGQRLALVLTKIDLVKEALDPARAESDFTSFKERIQRLFGDVFSVIQPFEIAAAPKTDQIQRGAGVPELLTFWLEPTPPAEMPPPKQTGIRPRLRASRAARCLSKEQWQNGPSSSSGYRRPARLPFLRRSGTSSPSERWRPCWVSIRWPRGKPVT